MQNSFKTVLLIVGVVLVAYGLYSAFAPQTVIDAGPLQVKGKSGLTTESLITIGLGVVALLAAVLSKKK